LNLQDYFRGLRYDAQYREALMLLAYMTLGGVLGYFIRALYRRFAATVSNRDNFSAIFPILTISTILIIFVVKSSLALSLGLVGALSIVRFRAAIKEPEEIVYLFFCIAVGLALGAEYYMLPVAGILIFAAFVILGHFLRRKKRTRQFLLTVSGEHAEVLDGDVDQITSAVEKIVGPLTVQNLDIEDGHLRYRVAISSKVGDIGAMVEALKVKLPGFRVSYANLQNLL
jgi:hypothetical protein